MGRVMTIPDAPAVEVPQLPEVGHIYTNLDHSFDDKVVGVVGTGRARAGHTAWDYFGWIWFADGVWVEVVRSYGVNVAAYASADLRSLIGHVIERHGRD